MNKKDDVKLMFPPPPFGFGGIVNGLPNFDPLGSYTGRAAELDEIPVQDADDL